MLHLFAVPPDINLALYGLTFLAALWRGAWRERAVAGPLLLIWLATHYVCAAGHCPVWPAFGGWAPIVYDIAQLAVCLVCARDSHRYWTIFASALALLDLVTALAMGLPRMSLWALTAADYIWCYGMALTVIWAALTRRREGAA